MSGSKPTHQAQRAALHNVTEPYKTLTKPYEEYVEAKSTVNLRFLSFNNMEVEKQ
jgi:hypothetical protein